MSVFYIKKIDNDVINIKLKYNFIKKIHPKHKGCIFMFEKRKKEKKNILINQIDNLNRNLLESNIIEISQLLGNRKKLLVVNLISGISRGIGIGIGVTLITAILVWILQKIVTLNIPVIGEYVSDIVEIVMKKY